MQVSYAGMDLIHKQMGQNCGSMSVFTVFEIEIDTGWLVLLSLGILDIVKSEAESCE
jgi:hypothetical protein